jgi:UDP-2,3-diacylglucosamine pyrophosphatase LpxH
MKNKLEQLIRTANPKQLIKKPISILMSCLLLTTVLASFTGCNSKGDEASPLWEAGPSRNKTVVISDLHLGIDDRYTETIENRPFLVEFLQRLRQTDDVKELVIAGDFLDDWYLPVYHPSYTDVAQFYEDCIANNQAVIDALNKIISDGIVVAYVPGNHDLLLESNVLDEALPGVIQGRDVRGLGVYYGGEHQEIAIEHGHRYDVFSAPDTITNAALTGNDDTILPPGYFYARYAATWVLEGRPVNVKTMPDATDSGTSNVDQYGAYLYHSVIKQLTQDVTPNEPVDAEIFDMRIAGFNDSYSFRDFYPYEQANGTITADVLFPNFQRTWDARQQVNRVKVTNTFIEAVAGTVSADYFISQAKRQYLYNYNSTENVDVVVFGHTHVPVYKDFGDGKYYVNAGTWVDHNNLVEAAVRTFVVVESGEGNVVTLNKIMDDGSVADITATYTVTGP